MGFKQDFKKATQELKKRKKQESTGFKSDFKNALGEIRNNAGQSRNKTTLTPTIQATKTSQNLVTNPLIKSMMNEADKNSASKGVNVRELATNLLVRDIEDRAKEIAQDNYQKSRALSAMRRTPSASAGGDFMNNFLSSDAFYYNLSDNDDFQEYAKKGKARVNVFPQKNERYDPKKHGNKVESARINIDASKANGGEASFLAQMTDDEVDIYNYLLGRDGYDAAEDYLNKLQNGLTIRRGQEWADNVKNSKGFDSVGMYTVASIGGGLDRFFRGVDSLPGLVGQTDDAAPVTSMEIANEDIIKDLDGVGYYLYGAGNTVGNMLPSLAVGQIAGPLVGSLTMGVSSAGDSYRQAINEGYSPKQARQYGIAVGASEAALQYLLGGIGKLGGVGSEKVLNKVKLIDSALARTMLTGGVRIGSEIREEELQLFLEPAFRDIIFGEEYTLPEVEEILDTAIMTAISTGALSGGEIARAGKPSDNSQLGQEFRGYNDKDTDIVQVAIEEGLSTPKGSESYTMAKALDKKVKNGGEVSDHQLGTLIEANRRNVKYEAEADVDTTSSETFTQDTRNMSLEDRIRQAKAKEGVTLETPIAINPNSKVGTVDQKTISSFGYGKTGTAAITDIVSKTNMAPEQARRRFQSAYEAGRLNLDRSKVDLIDNIQETAYIAGRKDAILEMDTLEGNDVSSWGKKSGLVKNEFSAKYDKKTYSTVNTIAKAMGTKVIVENIPQEMNSNGYYRSSDGTIHIDANLDEPVMTVVKHEITHRMKDLAPKEYMAYRDFAVEVMSDWGLGSKTAVESIQFDYHDRGNIDLDVESAMDEIAADMTRAILSDEKALRRFIDHAKTSKANMNMANKFFQAVREFINKVKATFGGNRQKMDEATRDEFGLTLEQLERAESLWKEAYRASEMSAKKINKAKTTGTDTGIKKSLKKGDNKIYNYNKTFAEQIEDWKKGLIPENDSLLVGSTPEIFKQIGFNDLPVTINQKHVDYAVNGTLDKDHFLGETLLKQLPQALKNPVAIIKSQTQPNRVVAVLKIQHNGKNIIAAVQVDGYGTQNNVRIDSNSITSVFEKNNAINKLLVDSLNDEANKKISVFYWNKKEALSLLQRPGLQLPNRLPQDGFIHSIREKGANVNIKFENVTETQQFKRWFGDSKVVNEDGTPKVVYHGTNSDFAVFDLEKSGKNFKDLAEGMFFFTNKREAYPNSADDYAKNSVKNSGGNEHIKEVYLTIEKPLILDSKGYYSTNEYYDRNVDRIYDMYLSGDYDGVIIENSDKSADDSILYAVDNSTQIKSATDNIGTFDKNDPNIHHSLKGESKIMKDYARLKKINEQLKEQFKLTTVTKADRKSLEKFTKELLKDYSSKADLDTTIDSLDSLLIYMVNKQDGQYADFNEVMRRAEGIASYILKESVEVDNELYNQYADLRKYLRTTPIKFDITIDEVPIGYDGFSDFKKQNMGNLKFANDGISIETMYGELSELYPEFFNSQEEVTSSDKFGKIVEVLNALKPLEFNPYESDIEDATQFLADDIVNRVFQLPAQKPTFADKQKQKLDDQKAKSQEKIEKLRAEKNKRISELIKENRERVKEVRQEQIKKKNEAVEKISQKYKDITDKGRELRKAKALRDKITSHANELSKKLLKGTDKQHIPQELQGPVAKLLECINLESNYTYDKSSGSYKKNDEGLPSRRTVAFNELREAYAKISSSVVVDPDLMGEDGLLSSVISLANKRIVDMTSNELNTVWQAIRAIEASVNTANKLFSQSKFESISGIAEEMKVQNAGKKYKSEFQGLVGDGKKLTALDMLTPETYFHFLGNAGDSIFRMMRDAQDKHIMITKETENFTHTELPEAKVNKLENKLHTVTLGGEKIKLSTAQLMELYVLMKRNQAVKHILKGGILPDVTKSKVTRVKPIRDITVDEVSDALSLLTDEQKQIADKLQRYASDVLSKYGNEASMQVYNYKKFNEENYWPIRTNKQEIPKEPGESTAVTTVANKGMTKTPEPNASTSIRLGSIFDTFSSHSTDMATYAAWLGASEDVKRIRNFVFWDDGVRRGTVEEILDTVHGTHGSKYLEKLLTDVSIGVKGTDELGMIDKITGNYKAASVGTNIRVIIQQPTAILRAMDMLGPQYFVAGVGNPIKGWEKAKKYAPIAQWKDWGYFDINTGRQMKDILFDNARRLDKIKQAGMWGASTADSLSWGQLWNAVEAETKFKHKDLKVGSKEYYEAVARRFTEIVDHTQVVDGIMQRSQIMRSSDKFAKMATSFMGEPTKQYNMMVSAAYDAKNTKGAERKRAVARLGRTATSLAISGILNACAQSIIDALRDDDKEEKYWEKWLESFIGYGDDAKWYDSNLVDAANPLSYIPLAKDLMSILRGYDVKRMDTEAIAKTYRASENLYKAITGTGKYTIAEGSAQVFAEVSRLFGLPVANLKRDAESIIMTTAIETDNYLMQYYIDKTLLNIEYKTNKSDFVKILFNAYNNDQEAYEVIYNDLIKEGYTDSEIKKKMENFMKKKENVNDVSDLSKRYYAPTQEGQYDAIVNELQNSDIWADADEEKQKKVYDTINTYFSGEGETSEELRREIEDGKKYGVDESEYLLYKLALQMVDQDEGKKGYGSYSLSEKAEAISMQNLSNDELAYLWDTEEGWEAYKKGIRMSKYIDFKDAASGFKADKDKNGKTISGSKKEKVVKYLNKSKLSDKEWDYFYYELMDYKK